MLIPARKTVVEQGFDHTQTMVSTYHQNFLHGLQNCQYLLNKLDQSIQKTRKYETQLVQCKASHVHSHHSNERCERGQLGTKETMSLETEKPSASSWRSPIDLAESWSTMSIVCLQYQYEELSKRYESLLRAYDDRCSALSARDASTQRLRERVTDAQQQCACAHQALLSVGEKYLALRCKKMADKRQYENKVGRMRRKFRRLLLEAASARLELDQRLEWLLACEHDAAIALLLAEVKKCNLLCLENMRLKVEIEEISTLR